MPLVLLGMWETSSSNRWVFLSPPGYLALGCCFVSVASPGGDEGGEVPVIFMQGNAMVAIPAVKHGFLFATWYGVCLVERALSVVGFPGSVDVQRLDGNCASRLAIFSW